jgi:SH3-like domain-containing protein
MLLLFGLCLSVRQDAIGDVVVLKNGIRLQCTVTAEEADGVRYTMSGIAFKVYTEGVASIVREGEKPIPDPKKPESVPLPTTSTDVDLLPKPTATLIQSASPEPSPEEEVEPTAESTRVPVPIPRATPKPAEVKLTKVTSKDVPPFPYPGKEPLLPVVIPTGEFRSIAAKRLRLRQGPSQDYPKVDNLDEDEIVTQMEEEDHWYHVKTPDGREGWVLADLTKPVTPEVVLVNGVRVSLRTQYGIDQPVIRPLSQGEVLIMLGRKGEWARVRDLDGKFGWVAFEYLDPIQDMRIIRNPISLMPSEETLEFLKQAVGRDWVPSGQDRIQLQLKVHNEDLVKGGQIVLIGLRDLPRGPGESPLPFFQSDDQTWQGRFSTLPEMRDLGLSVAMMESAEEATVLYLRGRKVDFEWSFTVSLDKRELSGSRVGIVVQKGPKRGACAIFADGLPE